MQFLPLLLVKTVLIVEVGEPFATLMDVLLAMLLPPVDGMGLFLAAILLFRRAFMSCE